MNKISLPSYTVEKTISISLLSETIDWGLLNNKVPDAWKTSMGEGVNVFILDTAGTSAHPDLKENLLGGTNFSSSRNTIDNNGHGTHCAGIIAASKNTKGMVGVAPKTKIYLVKVLDDNGGGSISAIEKGLRFCYDLKINKNAKNKPDIISLSLGSDTPLPSVHAWIKKLYELDVPVVCAAGNSGKAGVVYPARYPETIAIAAHDINNNIGVFSTSGEEVDFSAPGVNIYSTWKNNSYAVLSGTSMATPYITGVISLLLSKHKKQEAQGIPNNCKTIPQIVEHLVRNSVDKGVTGKDNQWGWGIIDTNGLITESKILTIPSSKEELINAFIKTIDKKYKYSSATERAKLLADLYKIAE